MLPLPGLRPPALTDGSNRLDELACRRRPPAIPGGREIDGVTALLRVNAVSLRRFGEGHPARAVAESGCQLREQPRVIMKRVLWGLPTVLCLTVSAPAKAEEAVRVNPT